MGRLRPDSNFLPGLVAEEDALLGLVSGDRVHARDARSVARCCVNRKSAVDIPSGLIKLNSLPSILRCLRDTGSITDILSTDL